MLSPENTRSLYRDHDRGHPRIPNGWLSPTILESVAFPVVLRADVKSAELREKGIAKGAAIGSTWRSINVLMYYRMGRFWHVRSHE